MNTVRQRGGHVGKAASAPAAFPADIPADVWAAAENAFDTVLCNDIQASGTPAQFRADSITDIARAIMAERERCAAVVENGAGWISKYNHSAGMSMTKAIAAAIRKGAA